MGGLLDARTEIWPGASSRAASSTVASPQITDTLFFLRRKRTPPFNWADTARERFTTAAGSGVTEPLRVRP
jgi:hypothetical protein